MKTVDRLIVTGAMVGTLSGCANFYPLPIEEPPAKDASGARTVPDYQRGGLLPATTISEAIANMKIYGDSYQNTADKLRRNEYVSSDIGFAGGVVGIVGGIAKSVETAVGGAVVASGSSVVSQRYQFLVQASNYEKASDAMYCMYSKLFAVDGGGLDVAFANERIDEVRRKLRKVQSTVQLASPDLTQLETALKKTIEDTKKVVSAESTASQKQDKGSAESLLAKVALDEAKLEKLKSDLTTCVASF